MQLLLLFKKILPADTNVSLFAIARSLQKLIAANAGCNVVLHCNGRLNEMKKVAENAPFLSEFLVKKTSQIAKNIS